jgi:hypothetical protein
MLVILGHSMQSASRHSGAKRAAILALSQRQRRVKPTDVRPRKVDSLSLSSRSIPNGGNIRQLNLDLDTFKAQSGAVHQYVM